MRIFCFLGKRGRRGLAVIRRYDIVETANRFRYLTTSLSMLQKHQPTLNKHSGKTGNTTKQEKT